MFKQVAHAWPALRPLCSQRIYILLAALLMSSQGYALSFDSRVDIPVGIAPLGADIGDIDGDGQPDLVVAIHEEDTVVVLRNTSQPGTLSFGPPARFPTGLHPQGLALADIDGDGKLDVLTANSGRGGGGTLTVLRNTSIVGNPSLGQRLDKPVDTAHRLVVEDFDGDSRLDIAITSNSSRTVFLFRNTSSPGTLSLASAGQFSAAGFLNSIIAADIDGDQRPDFAITISDTDTLSVYRNTSSLGSISFAPNQDFSSTDNPDGLDAEDMDGDSKPDIVVANVISNTISLFVNRSTPGSIVLGPVQNFPAENRPRDITLPDLDGDGKPDVAVPNPDPDTISIFKNTSAGNQVSLDLVLSLTTGASPFLPAIGDLDGDGAPDMAASNHEGTTVSVFRNTGAGFLAFPLPGLAALTARVSAILDHSLTSGYYCRDTHLRDDSCTPAPPRACRTSSRTNICFMGGDGVVRAFTGVEGRSEFLAGEGCSSQCSRNVARCGAIFTSCGYPNSAHAPFRRDDLGGINYVGVASLGGSLFLQYDGHSGYDYLPAPGEIAILAPFEGELVHVGLDEDPINGDGTRFNTFKIVHPPRDGFIYETWYLHAKRNTVLAEGRVNERDKVAEVGCTGLESNGCPIHLHFEVRRYPVGGDPLKDSEIVDPYAARLWR